MSRRPYLADKSALERRKHSATVRNLFIELAADSLLATCEMVALEVLYSARNVRDYERLRSELHSARWLNTTNEILERAMDVQALLARRGQHRLPVFDLIIAATAEHYGATVLHHDRDYEIISAVTGQPQQWVDKAS